MAGRGRPQKVDTPRPACTRPGHSTRLTYLAGRLRDKTGATVGQRFLCSPGTAEQHTFSGRVSSAVPVRAETGTTPKPAGQVDGLVRPFAPPQPCPQHPGSRVARYGIYGTSRKRPRQRYLCTPQGWYKEAKRGEDPAHAKHVFTPVLPREHVEGEVGCEHCLELRAIHRGDPTSARQHQAPSHVVAEALSRLGRGDSYSEVGLWVQGQVKTTGLSTKNKDAWRRAADLVEVFAPVLWEDWTATQRAANPPPDLKSPRVVLLDDLPMFSKRKAGRGAYQRFAVLAAAEAVPDLRTGHRVVQLRTLRALPTHESASYRLLLDDLVTDYEFVPDVVVADGGKGIRPAVEALADRTGQPVLFLYSHFHIKQQLGRLLARTRTAEPGFNTSDLEADVARGSVLSSANAWERWWNTYEQRREALQVRDNARWRRERTTNLRDPVHGQLQALATLPDIPRSTGGLEDLLARHVKPSITARSRGFGNLARTQQLLDLMVLHTCGYFDNQQRAIRVIHKDAATGDPNAPGFMPPVRQLIDPGLYRSLLDPDIVGQLTVSRGL